MPYQRPCVEPQNLPHCIHHLPYTPLHSTQSHHGNLSCQNVTSFNRSCVNIISFKGTNDSLPCPAAHHTHRCPTALCTHTHRPTEPTTHTETHLRPSLKCGFDWAVHHGSHNRPINIRGHLLCRILSRSDKRCINTSICDAGHYAKYGCQRRYIGGAQNVSAVCASEFLSRVLLKSVSTAAREGRNVDSLWP